MKYDIIITQIDKSHVNTIAKLICADPSISRNKALSMLSNPPLTYKRFLEKKEVEKEVEKLKNLGTEVKIVESKEPKDLLGTVSLKGEKTFEDILSADDKIGEKKEHSDIKPVCSPTHKKVKVQRNISQVNTSRKKKKESYSAIIVIAGFFIIVLVLVFQGAKKPEYKIKTDKSLLSKSSSSAKNKRDKKYKEPKKELRINIFADYKEKKAKEKAQKISESNSYSDSAELFEDDPEAMIRFYKIAISINKYNFNAWNGLVNAYANMGMTKEAYRAKEEMKKLFGDQMFSVEEIVRPYGKLINYSNNKDGVCRIEYKSKSTKKTVLETDSYNILRALAASGRCKRFSLYAATGKGKGLLVRYDQKTFAGGFSDYLVSAQINFIE